MAEKKKTNRMLDRQELERIIRESLAERGGKSGGKKSPGGVSVRRKGVVRRRKKDQSRVPQEGQYKSVTGDLKRDRPQSSYSYEDKLKKFRRRQLNRQQLDEIKKYLKKKNKPLMLPRSDQAV